MDDLISRKAFDASLADAQYKCKSNGGNFRFGVLSNVRENLAKQPAVEAVPLDKLCEWLETDCILSCVSCEHLFGGQWCKQHPELPYRCHRKEHWKDALTKWMEELDDGKEPV